MDGPLQKWAKERGYRAVSCALSVVDEIRAAFAARKARGEFEPQFYGKSLSRFRYLDSLDMPEARTVIVVTLPRPTHRLVFESEYGPIEAIIPPTYIAYSEYSRRVRDDLAANLLGREHRLAPLSVPLKTLATSTGLVAYGRNNITYGEGTGSYHQLTGYATDAALEPLVTPEVKKLPVMPSCEKCDACRRACPTGAIGTDRFLLHAERCLTFLNEFPGAFPEWVPSSAHHCLVGCMICQQVCPENTGLFRVENLEPSFTVEETSFILRGECTKADPQSQAIKAKLESVGLVGYQLPEIARNLKPLAGRSEPQ